MQNTNWSDSLNIAITVSDREGKILYMNDKSAATFHKYGGAALVGSSLRNCHKPESWSQIMEMIASGSTNVYTIEKEGVRKLICQTPWYTDGKVSGLVELSLVLPEQMPHFVRK